YFKRGYSSDLPLDQYVSQIEFFIDPTSGQVFVQKDIDAYFKRLGSPQEPQFFKPIANKQILQNILLELVKCNEEPQHAYKQNELRALIQSLE
ncbi:MAG: hypothetical protein WKF70_12470, partial [Chitinophagaceae bacterium]